MVSRDVTITHMTLRRDVTQHDCSGPICVHCSAGVGRTGTIISLHLQMENVKKNNKINIYDTVVQLRKCRKIMVQTESQ